MPRRRRSRPIAYERGGKTGASRAGRVRKYLFSGILKCAECGQSLIICDAYRYRCSSNVNGGHHACAHDHRYDRRFIQDALLGTIRDKLLASERIERFRRGLQAGRSAKVSAPVTNADRVAALDHKIARFVAAVADGYASPALRAQLEGAEAEKAALLSAPKAPAAAQVVRLVTDALQRYRALIDNLAEALSKDPERAQETLAAVFGVIPVNKSGQARVTLDVARMLEFTGKNLVGSGGRI